MPSSEQEKKEYELYQELRQIQHKEMYHKSRKTLKPSFAASQKLIEVTENIRNTAEQMNLISLEDGNYKFISFDGIEEFVSLYM